MHRRVFARVAIEKSTVRFDKLFDYAVPEELAERLQPGCRVIVPFGRGNQKMQALVFALTDHTDYPERCKAVVSLVDEQPLINAEGFEMIEYLKQNTFCTYYDAVRVLLPVGFNVDVVETFHLSRRVDEVELESFSEAERNVIAFLKTARNKAELDRFLKAAGNDAKDRIVESLIEKGVVVPDEKTKRRVGDETIRMLRLSEKFDPENVKLSPKQKGVVELLSEVQVASVKECCYFCGITEAVLKTLAKKNIVEYYDRQVYRRPKMAQVGRRDASSIKLSPEQLKVFSGLYELYRTGKPEAALLNGITGSGKTQVFLKLIDLVVAEGRQAIMMVPEISLTPQMVSQFIALFGDRVAVIHSGLSLGERADEYQRIKNGSARIVVGTRSAVFAPCDNIGLIVMDEEGEYSYKSESAPRYHARDLAKLRCARHGALLLLASATPSVDSYYRAKTGKYHLFELKKRYSDAILPDVYLVDLRGHLNPDQSEILSDVLIDELYYNLKHGEQSILLLNRRGYHTFATCMDCGEVDLCPHCSVALTYHKANGRMMCHYCGYSHKQDFVCPHCGGKHIKLTGLGTQKLEDEVSKLFPDARILRMDTDTTFSRFAYEEAFEKFGAGGYDIMLGTQMIAKGLDFPNVTLVGVLSVDKLLYSTDFRSNERTFSLVTQVVGRSGRGSKAGRAFIQTYTPDNPVLNFAAHQNYEAFYNDEIAARKALLYPPFCDICVVGFAAVLEQEVKKAAYSFMELLKTYIKNAEMKIPVRVLGPVEADIYKLNNKYRYRIVIKCRANKAFKTMIGELLRQTAQMPAFSKTTVFADLNGEINI
ncbi:MAG: replication restart helicase PriA [Oscillospiraceae bacterium]|jgi:primosomal protein N' (replication factor Y)